MKILLTNDDGFFTDGINAIFKTLSKKHEVYMVAPDREQSASSHSLTLNHPLRLHKIDKYRYSTDGTPTDCIMLAVHHLFKHKKPDMIISGINHGGNMGDDVTYSGTVAAAIEGSILRVPSIAVSMANYKPETSMNRAAKFINKFVNSYHKLNLKPRTFLNINFPIDNGSDYKEFEYTSLGFRIYKDIVIDKTDPRGKPYYWIGGKPTWTSKEGTDFNAVRRGVVSISPLALNFTDSDVLEELKKNK